LIHPNQFAGPQISQITQFQGMIKSKLSDACSKITYGNWEVISVGGLVDPS